MNKFNQLLFSSTLLASLFLTGCQTMEVTEQQVSCDLPHQKRLDEAILQTKKTLSQPYCQAQYREQFSALVDIAAGDPKEQNLDIFGSLVHWMRLEVKENGKVIKNKKGFLTKQEANLLFGRYFSPRLVSLDYQDQGDSQCTSSQKQKEINQLLQSEMDDKKRGLAKAIGNTAYYQQALKKYQDLMVIFEATQAACHHSF